MQEGLGFLGGMFLISNSTIRDPNFFHKIVLIIDHNRDGAFGLVVNHKSPFNLDQIVSDDPLLLEGAENIPIYLGGPVQPEVLFILHALEHKAEGCEEIFPGVYLASEMFVLRSLLEEENKQNFHVFLGYSGWGAGQLEAEMATNSWVTIKANKDIVFNVEEDDVWRNALSSKGGIYKYFADNVNDPMFN